AAGNSAGEQPLRLPNARARNDCVVDGFPECNGGFLHQMGLMSDAALEAATVEIIHPDFAKFSADYISYEVVSTRFQLQSESEPFVRTSDTAAIIFGKLLPHTPIQRLGINLEAHFNTLSPNQRIHLGRTLAPLEPWGSFGRRIQEETGERRGG